MKNSTFFIRAKINKSAMETSALIHRVYDKDWRKEEKYS